MERTDNCLAKVERVHKALRHQEPDRVPVSDSFWSSFLKRWREELGLPADTDIYRYYDLDFVITVPNLDPHIKSFETLREDAEEVVVRTGFEAVLQKKFAAPMPAFLKFETDTIEKLRAFRFDDPWGERRYLRGGDNQLAGVGDTFSRNLPPWIETVKSLRPDFAVFGSVCEAYETLWRIIGSENALLWIGLYPDEIARFVARINEFALETARAQIKAASGLLDGMIIWGDVAYRRGMFFSPDYWRRHFLPGVQAIVAECHAHGLPVIYHGCGNAQAIYADLYAAGIDGYNPLEAKAGLDVIALRRQYGHQIFAFWGNMDVMLWAEADEETLKRAALSKLEAARGGGYIFGSDHSVPSSISGARYDQVIRWVRQYGQYPLHLPE
jgi:uroporphyrinogen decarboxylase